MMRFFSLFLSMTATLLTLLVLDLQGKPIDLRGLDFSDGRLGDTNGAWEFYWQQLLTPEDFAGEKKYEPAYIEVPGSWHNQGHDYSRLGFGTYRTTILLPPNHSNLTILIPEVFCAAKIWLNGSLTATIGQVSDSQEGYEGKIASAVLSVPAKEKEIELVIQVANFTAHKGGLIERVVIGDASALSRSQNINRGIGSFFAGSLVAMFIQQFILFLMYRRGKSYLYLSLICLAVAIRAVITNSVSFLVPDLFSVVPFEIWKKAEYFSVYAIVAFFPLYISSLFPEEIKKIFLRLMVVLAVVLCLSVLITPLHFYGQILDLAHIGLLSGFAFSFWAIFQAWKKGNPDARIIFFGVAVSFPFTLIEILKNSMLQTRVLPFDLYLVELGLLVFLLFQVYLLANYYSNSYQKLELYSHSLEDSVKTRTEELSRLNEIKDKLLSVVSHDLRSPLNSLKGILHVYNIGAVSKEEMDPFLNKIEDELSRTNILVDNVLFWATDQMQGQGISLEDVDLHQLSEEHLEMFQALAGRKSIQLINSLPHGQKALADKSVVSLVLRNLITNAIKFTKENGSIELSSQTETGQVILTVQDSGIGMTEQQVNSLFLNKLIKSSRGTADEKGVGIGLSLCSDYLKKIGGSLWVESKPGAGSRFYVSLPSPA